LYVASLILSIPGRIEHKRKVLGRFTTKSWILKKTVKKFCLSKKLKGNKKVLYLFLSWVGNPRKQLYEHRRHYKIFFVQVPSSNDDSALADKEAILATLNIKAMTFDDTFSALARSKKIVCISQKNNEYLSVITVL
jgi:hypothetical protein